MRTFTGRKRRLPDAMMYEDTPARGEAERQSINSPVQGFANEINLMAALQLWREYNRKPVHIIGTVHDAVLVEVKDNYVEEVHNRLLTIMRRPDMFDDFEIKFRTPIEAEAKIGAWSKGVSIEEWRKR